MSNWAVPLDQAASDRVRVRHFVRGAGALAPFAANAHDAVEIAWVHRGHVRYRVGGRTFDLGPGQVMVVPAGVVHLTEIDPATEARSVWFGPEAGAVPLEDPALFADEDLAWVGRLLHAEVETGLADRDRAVDGLTEALGFHLDQHHRARPGAPRDDGRIARAVQFIEDGYTEAITVADIAKAAGMSRAHFSRAFRAVTGRAPYVYVQDVRVRRARGLLGAGHSVTDAAMRAGFADLSRFSRAFRDRVGVAPSRVRRLSA